MADESTDTNSGCDAAAVPELVSTRVFPWSPETVFAAWESADEVARWWGPNGFSNHFTEFGLESGARWTLTMRSADGVEYPNKWTVDEVEPARRLTMSHLSEPRFRTKSTFEEVPDGTRLTFRMMFETSEILVTMIGNGVPAFNEQLFDRLNARLAELEAGAGGPGSALVDQARELVITRVLDAPRDRVFAAWTEAETLKKWWGGAGIVTPTCVMDLRAGGRFFTDMRNAETGERYPMDGVYLEVSAPDRLVFSDAFRAGWLPNADAFIGAAICTFEDVGGGRTRFTARAMHRTPEDCRKHRDMGFYKGWGATMDRLGACLANG